MPPEVPQPTHSTSRACKWFRNSPRGQADPLKRRPVLSTLTCMISSAWILISPDCTTIVGGFDKFGRRTFIAPQSGLRGPRFIAERCYR